MNSRLRREYLAALGLKTWTLRGKQELGVSPLGIAEVPPTPTLAPAQASAPAAAAAAALARAGACCRTAPCERRVCGARGWSGLG